MHGTNSEYGLSYLAFTCHFTLQLFGVRCDKLSTHLLIFCHSSPEIHSSRLENGTNSGQTFSGFSRDVHVGSIPGSPNAIYRGRAFLLLWRVPLCLLLKNTHTWLWCYHHTLLLAWYCAGDKQCVVFCRFLIVWESALLLVKIPSGFSCVFTEQKLESGHIKPKIGGVLQWCLSIVNFSHHHDHWAQPDHQLLGHPSNLSLSPSIAQFGQEASSRKSPDCSKLLPLRIIDATCFCEPSIKQFFL